MIALTWVGHATVAVDLDGVRLLTDPLLRNHSGPLRRTTPLPPEQTWAAPDAVLLSHLHHDHAESASLRIADAPHVLTSRANATWLRRIGLQGEGVGPGVDVGPWHRVRTTAGGASATGSGEVEVRLVRADHRNRPMPHRPNDAHGHLVRGDAGVLWFAGDTSLYDDMQALPELAGAEIDLALVPIGGWGPRLSPGHLGPREAARACALVRPRAVLPIHYGTFHPFGFHLASLDWMHRPLEAFARELAEQAPTTRLVALRPGESTIVEPAA